MHCNPASSAQFVHPGRKRPTSMSSPPVQHRIRQRQLLSGAARQQHQAIQELDDAFTGLSQDAGLMTVTGFGSLLSERSARTTFPDLQNFRAGRLYGYRRVFAHTADIFFLRGIANPDTREMASLSCEPYSSSSSTTQQQQQPPPSSSSSNSNSNPDSCCSSSLVVSLFEVPFSPDNVAAFIAREHEFRFLAVQPYDLAGKQAAGLAVLCGANTDEHYKATRCPPEEWQRRWGVHGIDSVWRSDVLPCRVYLRHCVLAAKGLCEEAYQSFLDDTYLADRVTTIRQYLEQHPEIMDELPPPELVGRYSG